MNRLFRIFHWRARARYWRQRHDKAVALVGHLEALLAAETHRNREREDMFVSASVMGGRQMYGIAPRSGPAAMANKQLVAPSTDMLHGLTGPQRLEWEMYYAPDAQAANVPLTTALQVFRTELAARKAHNDEPMTM